MSTTKLTLFLLTTTIFIILSLNPVSPTTEFVFNANFSSTNLLLFGNATIQSSILSLTNDSSTFSMGRALYPFKIPTKTANSSSALLPFSTSFIFSVAPVEHFLPGHGFAFLFSPHPGMSGTSSVQHLGLFNMSNDGNSSNHVLAVEFDVFKNQEFQDIDFNHVGLNLNSLTSVASHTAGFWGGKDGEEEFEELKIINGVNYQVWIEYLDSRINVTMAPVGRRKPRRPLISEFVNLSGILVDEMYAGFTGATGQLVESHRILAWSFSNTNFSIGDALVTRNLPSFVNSKGSVFGSEWFIVGVSVVGGFLLVGSGVLVLWFVVFRMKGKKKKENEDIEDWELEYWPHRFGNRDIYVATEGFSEKNVIGFGGNGRVYKGVLAGGIEVAVKRISLQNEHGMREFLAEVSSLGRLKHRNLVGLRGWCKSEQRSLVLVYDYMEKGSLDKMIFECKESMLLSWEERIKVLKDVACGILYLHEGWESKVLHRDIKASNVLLDKDMNARLGDFGLARMHDHGQLASTTRVVGTVGYMAPEMVQTGRPSVQTDVYGYGVLVLEVVCGRRPNEEGKPGLVDWVWRLMERGELVSALDVRLKSKGGYSMEEVEKVLYLGLLCVNPESQCRPTMREVLKVLEMKGDALESTDDEGMEVSLLEKMRSTTKLSKYRRDFSALRHPTFEEIRRSHSSSISLSGSDIIRVGR